MVLLTKIYTQFKCTFIIIIIIILGFNTYLS